MHKLVLFIAMSVFYIILTALQLDEEMAVRTLFRAKHSLNYAVHAASQQIGQDKLAQGVYSIDPIQARASAEQYLRVNMRLDSQNIPLPGSFLKARVDIPVFDVVDESHTFPFTYVNDSYSYQATLARPGVVMIIRVEYPRIFTVMGPITWDIKGSSELVY